MPKGLLPFDWGSSPGWIRKSIVPIAVLVVLNFWLAASRQEGPDPEIEALHSAEEAVRVCREEVESRLAPQNPSIVDPGRADYLQGGEYDVRFEAALGSGRLRSTNEILCQVQFVVETGWIVEDVSLDSN